MKKLTLLLAVLICCSCNLSLLLSGEYKTQYYSTEIDKPYDVVWGNIVDWFFETQTPIALIDKTNGLITSGKISLIGSSTYETNGHPRDVSKFVILPEDALNYTNVKVTGHVKVRVKTEENGKTKISVFLSDIDCGTFEAKSLGTFEQNWLKYISNK